MEIKTVVLIPPSARFKKQDFSIQRVATAFKNISDIKVVLLYIKELELSIDEKIYDEVISVTSEQEIFLKLKAIDSKMIINRAWMHNYSFAKSLVENFNNVVVNIKDWNFCSKDEYRFLFGSTDDFEAIEYIFENAKLVLSHFTQEQAVLWSKEYGVDLNRFVFFPEFCNKDSFENRAIEYKDIHLVYAGKIQKSTYPEQLFPAKSHLRSITKLTKQGFNIDFILPEMEYDNVVKNKEYFLDFLYENSFNDRFNLIRGRKLHPQILKKYHFGFFELEVSGKNIELFRYAIVSKFAFYLEASLPMLVNKNFISIAFLIKEHQLGVVFENKDIDSFDTLLDISQNQYDTYIKNIQKFRKSFVYENLLKKIVMELK